jgi:hypothetical protein
MRSLLPIALCALVSSCAYQPLSSASLDRAVRPAFISRIEDGAGPRAKVFRDDGAYALKLKKLDAKEADRRLQVKLQRGITRFEIAERLRVLTFAGLPQERPWVSTIEAAQVATLLQSFLVEEVPANPPEYDALKRLGADSVVEIVVEEYGMRSKAGKAGSYIKGYARMFLLRNSHEEIFRSAFLADALDSGAKHLDPFVVGQDQDIYRRQMQELIDGISKKLAVQLSPPRPRRASDAPSEKAPAPPALEPLPPEAPPADELPPGELPPPDPVQPDPVQSPDAGTPPSGA